eukprot:gene1641-3179_t
MSTLTLNKQILVDGLDSYVFDIDTSLEESSLFLSLSNNTVSQHDASTLNSIRNGKCHNDRINCIECSRNNKSILYTSSSDHSACIWDWRTPGLEVMKLNLPDEVFSISCGVDDVLLAASCGSSVHFFDIRGGAHAPLGEYADSHNDAVTVVKFCPNNLSLLVSGGEDGLLCLYDTSVSAEDSAVMSIFNTESPVRRIGFFGPTGEGILCLSSIETATAWHYPSAQRIGDYPAVRAEVQADYLVDCWYDSAADSVQLLTGDFSGNSKICTVQPHGITVVASITGGHRELIRCAKPLHSAHGGGTFRLVTGGEDARICLWSTTSTGSVTTEGKGSVMVQSRESKSEHLRYKPY